MVYTETETQSNSIHRKTHVTANNLSMKPRCTLLVSSSELPTASIDDPPHCPHCSDIIDIFIRIYIYIYIYINTKTLIAARPKRRKHERQNDNIIRAFIGTLSSDICDDVTL